MADKHQKDRRKTGPERIQRPDVTIHTADELEELFLASVRAGTFPAKFFPSWAARMQIEVGKVVREGKIQRPPQKVEPTKGVSAKAQKTEAKTEARKNDLPQVQTGIGKFIQKWNETNLPKLSFERGPFLQAYKDGNLAELLSRTIFGLKPADVEPKVYRLAVADFMKSKLGFKPHLTEKVIGKDGKKPVFEKDEEGKPVMVESLFDLTQELQDGVPRSKALLSLSEEEYQASQQWFPGVRASLRKLSGQNQVRSQPKTVTPPASMSGAGGGAARKAEAPKATGKSSAGGGTAKIDLHAMMSKAFEEDSDTLSVGSSIRPDDDPFEFAQSLKQRLHQEYPGRGFDKIDFANKDVAEHISLSSDARKFQSTDAKKFLELGERVGAFCCALYFSRSQEIHCRPTVKLLEYVRSGDLERIIVTESGREILDFLKKQADKVSSAKAGGTPKGK